jgi:Helix-turn-helix domain
MRQFRVVAGLDFSTSPLDNKKALAEARKRARPVLRQWLRRIELDVMAGQLSPLDFLMAKELCNYPSSNWGRCYAGQERLGAAVGSCARTARSSLKRLRDRGFIWRKRGGPGRSACWTFCVNGKPIFGGAAFLPAPIPLVEKQQHSAQDRKDVAGLDRKDVSAKPYEQDHPIEHNPSPLPPKAAIEPSGPTRGPPSEVSEAPVVDGEIITEVISFQEFWLAAGRRGHEGFARAEWRKLSATDKAAISDRLRRDGQLGLRNLWAGTWLRDRVWEEPAPSPPEPKPRFVRPIHVLPGSELWRAERERWRAAGYRSMVKLMDDFAAAGKGWTVQR